MELLHHLVKDVNMAQVAFFVSCFRASFKANFYSILCPGYVPFDVCITAQILRTFHVSFFLLRHAPPSNSFHFTFSFLYTSHERVL